MSTTLQRVAPFALAALAALGTASVAPQAIASSHREAPFITAAPKVDGTTFTCSARTSRAVPPT